MHYELSAYRREPSDRLFSNVYRVALPWLRSVGASTLKNYSTLSISGALDDLTIEGALAMSRSARRFVYFCDCGRAFVHQSDLSSHQREEHKRRGVPLVSLSSFAKQSARLAIRKTARRLVRSEILEPEIDLGVDEEAEASILFEVLISGFSDRIHARARESLRAILHDHHTEVDVDIIRDAWSHLG